MRRQIIETADGSTTIKLEDWNEQYHSLHGALAEAKHVFIESALEYYLNQNPECEEIEILEIGFGTGLNALLTKLYAENNKRTVLYHGIEAYPISEDELNALNYTSLLNIPKSKLNELHKVSWGTSHILSTYFSLTKLQILFNNLDFKDRFNIIYFDAFGARVQPELWTEDIFGIMYSALKNKGILTTYSAKGSVRRAMIASGFTVDKIPGPPGKREMLRAVKC